MVVGDGGVYIDFELFLLEVDVVNSFIKILFSICLLLVLVSLVLVVFGRGEMLKDWLCVISVIVLDLVFEVWV